ncbi:alpha/beta fold hydrolase [Myroides phaeus]|uniref:alpha/beta fold hydrolase n=1 Tax=Myroides phaeus TaxID=702745 RepID=UPI001302FBC8|nr:alpha/beta fold hydrolase [Myroides phaeus]
MNSLKEITLTNYVLPNARTQDFTLTYQVFGQPLHTAPIVVINHALTGNSDVSGENGWWKSLVGTNQVIDLNRYTVIAFDIPGNGYNQNPSHLITDYKIITTQLIADLFWKGLQIIGVDNLYAVVGGSLGGSIAWEMALQKPNAIQHLIPIATSIRASDWLIGNALVQDSILTNSANPIEDARMHAMLLYRTPASLQLKFNNQIKEQEEQYAIESWLKYHGKTLNNRFALSSYKLMNHLLKTIGHHLTEETLEQFAKQSSTNILSIAVDSDYMFTNTEQKQIVERIKKHKKNIAFKEIQSIHGHDAFLIEYEQLNHLLTDIF